MRDLPQLINYHTGLAVRIGTPNLNQFVERREVNDPRFATVLGLLKMADAEAGVGKKSRRRGRVKSDEPGIFKTVQTKLVQGVISFFEENPADTEMT